MSKIAIYDTLHTELIIPLAELLAESSYMVTFFVHESMRADLEASLNPKTFSAYQWIFLKDQPMLSLYRLLSAAQHLQHYDLFWLNTNNSKHFVFALLRWKNRKMRLAVNVHEINNFFSPRVSINLKRSLRLISKHSLLFAADAFIFNTENMEAYVQANRLTRKKCYVVTPVYYRPLAAQRLPGSVFSIVIPGTVDERRRDYQLALRAWKIFLRNKSGSMACQLVFAGAISEYGKAVKKICQADPELNNTVILFNEALPEPDFRQWLASSSALLSPQKIHTSTSDNIAETYGITKISGNTNDAIAYAKPYIIPVKLVVPSNLETIAIRYDGEQQLAGLLVQLSNDPGLLEQLQQKAIAQAAQSGLGNARQQLEAVVDTILTLQ